MDHPMTPEELAELARSLLIEKTPFEALAELGSLGEITAQSFIPFATKEIKVSELPPSERATPTTPVRVNPAPAVRPTIPARYEGKNLQDASLLQALMAFHEAHAPVFGAKTSPKDIPSEETKNRPALSGFSSAEIPVVDAQPKNATSMKRSTRPTAPVLRSSYSPHHEK